ncbi:hypothetical protein ACIA8O_13925 [Kitasatospora sp. NPDC051853]|uniref:hypothetical protein n=1 Tax=Kitasatospora sp. NPDC051853 TaxID=3364058 RepID=UPI00379B7E55
MSNGETGRQPQRTPGPDAPPPAFPSFGPPVAANGWARPDATEPDWSALADQHEQRRRRRRRLRNGGAVAGAVLLVGAITTTAVLLSRGAGPTAPPAAPPAAAQAAAAPSTPADAPSPDSTPTPATSPSASPSASTAPSPSATPSASPKRTPTPSAPNSSAPPAPPAPPGSTAPPDPLTVISSAATDTAPLDPGSLFPATTLTVGGRTWTRLTTAATSPCWNATTGGLGNVITPQGCQTLLRATYTSGNSAVTIGVAVFPDRAKADAATAAHQGQVQGLVPAGAISYCTSDGCTNTHAAVGRYTYYTVSGTVKPGGTTADPTATAAGPDFAAHARTRLLARGTR